MIRESVVVERNGKSGENEQPAREPVKHIVEIMKTGLKRSPREKLQSQVNKIIDRAMSGGRMQRGWRIEIVNKDEWLTPALRGGEYRWICKLAVINESKRRTEQALGQDFDNIVKFIGTAGSVPGWTVLIIDGRTADAKKDIRLPQAVGYVPVEIPDDWSDKFAHIYERESQIEIIMSCIQAGIVSNFQNRFHCALIGDPACIAGDAIVGVNRARKSFNISLEEMYNRFNNTGKHHGNAIWDKAIPTQIRCRTDDGKIRLGTVRAVVFSGEKAVYEITAGNKTLKATGDHLFLTKHGWVPLDMLSTGDEIAVAAGAQPRKQTYPRRRYRELAGMRHHPYAVRRNPSSAGLWFLPPELVVHHVNGSTIDNRLNNLEVISRSEHSRLHGKSGAWSNVTEGTIFSPITKIAPSGVANVYDVSLDGEPHNFLASGIVVHNCGKTETLRAVKAVVGEEAVLEYDATATTQAGAIQDLDTRDELPRILIVEEIEKTDPDSLRWLLGVMDHRAEIRKITARQQIQRETRMLTLATVNDYPLFMKIMYGALQSRFTYHLHFPRPDRDLLTRILEREIAKIGGKKTWIKPTLKYAESENIYDPRKVCAICLCGRDQLLSGEYQAKLKKCAASNFLREIEKRKAAERKRIRDEDAANE